MNVAFLDLKAVNARFEPQLSQAVQEVIASGWYINGRHCQEFEQVFARFIGTRHCVGTGNGLDALTLILTAMKQLEGWNNQTEVIVPAMTFIASAEAVNRAGLTPVLCDIDEDFVIDPDKIEPLIGPHTRALLPVHLYGHMANMTKLSEIASRYQLKIIEDAAQAHGTTQAGKRAGNWGNAAAFSFYPGKNLGALGDGGAVTTNDDRLAERIRTLANYGAVKKYHHEFQGINSRLDELQAAILNLKLPHLDEDNRKRQAIAQIYNEEIRNRWVRKPYSGQTQASIFHVYPLITPHRCDLQRFLSDKGIGTLIHYPLAIHQQTAYASFRSLHFPHAEQTAAEELSLPISPAMTEEEAHFVATTINHFKL